MQVRGVKDLWGRSEGVHEGGVRVRGSKGREAREMKSIIMFPFCYFPQ